MARPDLSKVASFYHNYINLVTPDDIVTAFKTETPKLFQFINAIPAGKQDYRYADGKWSIKELLQHMIDAERIFCYRALRFARKDTTPLSGFDENSYADNAKTENRKWDELADEFKTVRKGSEYMFCSFDEEQLKSSGISSNNSISVLAIGYIVVGHALHHINILKERYLN